MQLTRPRKIRTIKRIVLTRIGKTVVGIRLVKGTVTKKGENVRGKIGIGGAVRAAATQGHALLPQGRQHASLMY